MKCRVLMSDGTAVVTVPIHESLAETYEDFSIVTPVEREKHFGQWDYVRWYAKDVKDRFEAVGFIVEMVKYGDQFSKSDYERFGLCDDLIIVAKK